MYIKKQSKNDRPYITWNLYQTKLPVESGRPTNIRRSATYHIWSIEGPGPNSGGNFGHPNGFKQPGPLTVVLGMPNGRGGITCDDRDPTKNPSCGDRWG